MVLPDTELLDIRSVVEDYFPHRCDVYRYTPVDLEDPYGEEEPGTPTLHLQDQPCRLWHNLGRNSATGEIEDASAIRILSNWRMTMAYTTDVKEADTIVNIRDQQGHVMVAGPEDIKIISPNQVELVLVLQGQR